MLGGAMDKTIEPIARPFSVTLTPPGSKSLTNRALVLAALADGVSTISNVLWADDTQRMIEGLEKLGFAPNIDQSAKTIRITGQAGRVPAAGVELFCGNSGTTIRFLSALCSLGRGRFQLDGNERMRQRPIGPLVDLLRNFGVRCRYMAADGFPPIQIDADGLPGGLGRYGKEASSQFLSAVLMVAPYARHEVRIDLEGKQSSWPYVAMTMQLMDHFHVTAELIRDPKTSEPKRIIIPQATYRPAEYAVEPDASSAAYFLAAAALHPGSKITIDSLGNRSLQGDVGFADVLHRMGADLIFGKDFITMVGTDRLEGIDVNLSDMPDTAQTLAVVALFAKGETVIRGLHTLRVKETDRLAALVTESTKFGAAAGADADTLTIAPPEHPQGATVETYDDHRMAMSFALAGTKISGVTIRNIECVNKTYPGFFEDLEKLR
jgi:3-phosphoshikimate 1-carboxyvinyltransferase